MKAILLAAGKGTRLYPITKLMPKQMIPIAGKPILEYIIEDLKKAGIREICIVIGYNGKQIKKRFGNGKKFGVKITYKIQRRYKGTANALEQAKKFVNDESFLVYLSDTIIPTNFEKYILDMMKNKDDVSILVSKISNKEKMNVGNVEMRGNIVEKIKEKSNKTRSNLGWAGISLFKNKDIFDIIKQMSPSHRGEYEITDAINLMIGYKKKIRGYNCKQYIDSGTPTGLFKMTKYILKKRSKKNIQKEKSFKRINPIFIGKKCRIESKKIGPYVTIGNNVEIKNNKSIKNSIILDNTLIKDKKEMNNYIIYKNYEISTLD